MVDFKPTGLETHIKRLPAFIGITAYYEDGRLTFPSYNVQGRITVSDAADGYVFFVGELYEEVDFVALPSLYAGMYVVDFESAYAHYRGYFVLE